MSFVKLSVATTVAVIVLGVFVTAAFARALFPSNRSFRAAFAGVEFAGFSTTVRCPMTIEGPLHARVFKIVGSLVGSITRASSGMCSQGAATVLGETLPWHLRYAGFQGTLPNITSVAYDLVGLAVNVQETGFGLRCLLRSTTEAPASLTFTRGVGGVLSRVDVSGVMVNAGCFVSRVTLSGASSSLTVLGSASLITLTLV
jgi:hypothetical protein